MSKKDKFVSLVEKMLKQLDISNLSADEKEGLEYFNIWKETNSTDSNKQKFTENGILILSYIKDNYQNCNNMFKAKEIGEGLGITSKTASGAMRKLVTDGYLEKIGQNPVIYSLTEEGKNIAIQE